LLPVEDLRIERIARLPPLKLSADAQAFCLDWRDRFAKACLLNVASLR
jgi:hypothetical protein